MRFRLLGPLEFRTEGQWRQIPGAKPRTLLAMLLVATNTVVSTDEIADALWGDSPPVTATNQVYGYVARLRKLLNHAGDAHDQLIRRRPPGYLLSLDLEEVDIYRFGRLLSQGRAALRRQDPAGAAGLLSEGLELWRGSVLSDVPASSSLRAAVTHLEEQRLLAYESWAEAELACGRHELLVPELRGLVSAHPLREWLWRHYLVALYRCGRQSDALLGYQQLQRVLADELGVAPAPALQDLHRRMLRSDVGLDFTMPVPAPPTQSPWPTPRSLPPPISCFAGRDSAVELLDRVVSEQSAGPSLMLVHGMPGVGKTALAVHWSHRVAEQFPDGQLYVNLRGFDSDDAVLTPADALRGLLDALGVTPERLPARLEAQVGLYRSLLDGKRILVFLDNARDPEQVRPLLPGAGSAVTVVTSRSRMTSLAIADGAHLVHLGPLPADAGQELLSARLGERRVRAEPGAVARIVQACAGLPLALAITAARAQETGFPLAVVATELERVDSRLEILDAGDRSSQVRAAFVSSYRALNPPTAQLFRLLGLHPGADIPMCAAASLAGAPTARAGALLAELTRANLLTEHQPQRYLLHDLVRTFAAELARTHDSDVEQHAATSRLVDHYVQSAHRANHILTPTRCEVTAPPSIPGVVVDEMADRQEAFRWHRTELPTYLRLITTAARSGLHSQAWQLSWAVADYLLQDGHTRDILLAQEAALSAAQHLSDQQAQGRCHAIIARTLGRLGRSTESVEHFREALALFEATGDLAAQAHTNMGLGWVTEHADSAMAVAAPAIREALRLFDLIGDAAGHARAMNNLGWLLAHHGEYEEALICCRNAQTTLARLGFAQAEAHAWDSLGLIHRSLDELDVAADCYSRAVDLFQLVKQHGAEAESLLNLGETLHVAGRPVEAQIAFKRARIVLEELRDLSAVDRLPTP